MSGLDGTARQTRPGGEGLLRSRRSRSIERRTPVAEEAAATGRLRPDILDICNHDALGELDQILEAMTRLISLRLAAWCSNRRD